MLEGHRAGSDRPLPGTLDAEQWFEMIGEEEKDVRRTLNGRGRGGRRSARSREGRRSTAAGIRERRVRDGVERDDRQRELQEEGAPVIVRRIARRVERASRCPSAA